ncbi:MAG: serine/threonine protein kinase, partial [Ktedonobacteraceae bacterium]|nr:serine/threonine protein kinase [Ktedonobacteraceae bacterium]
MIDVFQPPLVSDLQGSFLKQTQALTMLDHPHILRLRDAGLENHHAFLVSDYVSHVTLKRAFPPTSKQPLDKVMPYLKQIASALHYIHQQQLLHGDVRPENILIDGNNQVLLWGFSIEAITQNQERLRSQKPEDMRKIVAYSAPERIQGKLLPAGDQYSFALIIYELLSGTLPFTGSYIQIATQQLQAPVPPLRLQVPGIPPTVESVIMKALSKDPQQRFPNVQAFISTLEQSAQLQPGQRAQVQAPTSRAVPQPPAASLWQAPPAPPTQEALPTRQAASAPASVQQHQIAPPAPPPPPAPMPPSQQQVTMAAAAQPPAPPPVQQALAPRRDASNTITRRAFAVGLVGLAALGGAGG